MELVHTLNELHRDIDWFIDDGVRSVDRQFQAEIDTLVEELIHTLAQSKTRIVRLSYPFDVAHILSALPDQPVEDELRHEAGKAV